MASGPSDYLLLNDVPYAKYVQNSPQDRMMTLRDWRSIQRVVHEERTHIQRLSEEALNRAVKKIRG